MKKRIVLVAIIVSMFLITISPCVTAQENDNIFDIWDSWSRPYTKLFNPVPSLFFVLLLGVIVLGVWMKTRSAGGVLVSLLIISGLLSGLVGGPGRWLFGVITAFAIGMLFLWILSKRRRQ